jgi:hypothetical protein
MTLQSPFAYFMFDRSGEHIFFSERVSELRVGVVSVITAGRSGRCGARRKYLGALEFFSC